MIRFMLFLYSTLARVRMPLAATVPNSTMPAPPRTGVGTAATTRPRTGSRPRITRITPPALTTKRLLTPVMATSPTFWAKALWVKELKSGEMALDSHVGAQPVADALGVDLGADDLADGQDVGRGLGQGHQDTISIEMMAATWKVGGPKANGVGNGDHRAFADLGEVGHADDDGDHGAEHHGQQDGQPGDGGAADLAEQQHDEPG